MKLGWITPCILLFSLKNEVNTESDQNNITFNGFKLIRVYANTAEKVESMLKFQKEAKDDMQLISDGIQTNLPIDILIHQRIFSTFQSVVKALELKAEVVVEDMQKVINAEKEELKSRTIFSVGQDPSTFTLDQYHRHDEINAYLKALNVKYPTLTSLYTVGYTFEGRQMLAIKVGKPGPNKKAYWIDAGIHAREWVAPATALFILSQLVNKYSEDVGIKNLVDSLDWYILPSANPDGYEYSWTNDRLWRKTRSFHPSTCTFQQCCKGTDPNRNWNYPQFGGLGTSDDPCDDTYKGPYAFSEPETKAMSKMILQLSANNNLGAYITLHSDAQLWLVPYGYAENVYPPDYNNLLSAAIAAEAASRRVHNVAYVVENSAVLYPAAGASDDWSKGVANATYVYTVELRGPRFILPAVQIIPTGEEVFAGVQSIANRVIQGI